MSELFSKQCIVGKGVPAPPFLKQPPLTQLAPPNYAVSFAWIRIPLCITWITFEFPGKIRPNLKTYSESCQKCNMELFVEIFNDFQKALTIFTKRPILDVWQGSEYASATFSSSERQNHLKFTFKKSRHKVFHAT